MKKYTYEINNGHRTGVIETAHGMITTPSFFPVTTFGDKFPLDKLVQPYLKRLSQGIMVSHYYAQEMKERPNLPIFIDSGGFASIFEGSEIIDYADCASIKTKEGEEIHPLKVLEFQEKNADLAATLDFLIPPGMDKTEAQRRQKLTIKNALYALTQKRSRTLFLYASLQCWDEYSARESAREYVKAGFDGIGIGGLVPRINDIEYIRTIVNAVREEAPKLAVHVFGIGKPEVLKILWQLGVDSIDSSSYIRNAVKSINHNSTFISPGKALTGPYAPIFAALDNLYEIKRTFITK